MWPFNIFKIKKTTWPLGDGMNFDEACYVATLLSRQRRRASKNKDYYEVMVIDKLLLSLPLPNNIITFNNDDPYAS